MQARQTAEEAAQEEHLMEIKPPKPEVEKKQSTKKRKSKKQGKPDSKIKNANQVSEQLTSPLDNEIPELQKSPLKQRIKDKVKASLSPEKAAADQLKRPSGRNLFDEPDDGRGYT